tara:strand:- start:6766 stop:6984 length:219 start_codon:yes stop_codon:yes gene_type:complete
MRWRNKSCYLCSDCANSYVRLIKAYRDAVDNLFFELENHSDMRGHEMPAAIISTLKASEKVFLRCKKKGEAK